MQIRFANKDDNLLKSKVFEIERSESSIFLEVNQRLKMVEMDHEWLECNFEMMKSHRLVLIKGMLTQWRLVRDFCSLLRIRNLQLQREMANF